MTLQTFLLYLATWTAVAIMPGPAVMCTMAQATRQGFRASLAGVAGVQLGNALFFVCVALGLATMLHNASGAFVVLRTAGAIYLCYLGVRMIYPTLRKGNVSPKGQDAVVQARHGRVIQGFLVQVTNPKALLFVSALLPQFINPDGSMVLQLSVLGATTLAVDTVVLGAYGLIADRGTRSLRRSAFYTWLERAFGGALVFFGLRLFTAQK